MLVVIYGTWGLLMQSLKLSLDAVPDNIDIDKIKLEAETITGVIRIEHIHIWAMSTTKNAMTGHVIVNKNCAFKETEKIKAEIKHKLEHQDIHHITLEIEYE